MSTPATAGGTVMSCPASHGSTLVGTFELNRFEYFAATLREHHGRQIVALTRWKMTPAGQRRMASIEFASHRTGNIVALLDEAMKAIAEGCDELSMPETPTRYHLQVIQAQAIGTDAKRKTGKPP
jgi:hypothetical protein